MLKRVQHAAISRPTQLVSNSELMRCVFMMCMNNWVRYTDMSYNELPDHLLWPREIKTLSLSSPLSMPAYPFKRAHKLRLCCPLLVTYITTSELLPEPKTILVILRIPKLIHHMLVHPLLIFTISCPPNVPLADKNSFSAQFSSD